MQFCSIYISLQDLNIDWFTEREEKFTRNVFWMMLDDYDTTKTFLIGRARVDHVPHYAAGI